MLRALPYLGNPRGAGTLVPPTWVPLQAGVTGYFLSEYRFTPGGRVRLRPRGGCEGSSDFVGQRSELGQAFTARGPPGLTSGSCPPCHSFSPAISCPPFFFLIVVQVQLSSFSLHHTPYPTHPCLPPLILLPFGFIHGSFLHVP